MSSAHWTPAILCHHPRTTTGVASNNRWRLIGVLAACRLGQGALSQVRLSQWTQWCTLPTFAVDPQCRPSSACVSWPCPDAMTSAAHEGDVAGRTLWSVAGQGRNWSCWGETLQTTTGTGSAARPARIISKYPDSFSKKARPIWKLVIRHIFSQNKKFVFS